MKPMEHAKSEECSPLPPLVLSVGQWAWLRAVGCCLYIHFLALYQVSWNPLCLGDMGQTSHNNPCCLNIGWGKKEHKTEAIQRWIFPRASSCSQSRASRLSWPSLAVWLNCIAEESSTPCLTYGLNVHIFHNELALLAFFWGHSGLQSRCSEQHVNISCDLPGKGRWWTYIL